MRALLVVIALGSHVLLAQQGPPRAVASLQRLRGTVVVDGVAATAVRRARVQVAAQGLTADPVFTTDAGDFEVLVPATMPYTVTVSKPGFVAQELRRGPGMANLQIRLVRGAVIAGRVSDTFGDPVRTRVRVRGAGREVVTDTDDLGEYRVGGLPAGRYEVTVMPAGASATTQAAAAPSPTVVQIGAGEETALAHVDLLAAENVTLQAGMPVARTSPPNRPPAVRTGAIRGRAFTLAGRPVGGAVIMAIWVGTNSLPRTTGDQMQVTMTDANGQYEFPDLLPGDYHINAAKIGASLFAIDRAVTATVRDRQVAEADVRLGPPGVVEGTVVDGHGEPVEGVTVEVWQRRTGGGRAMLLPANGVPARRTDDRGRYRLFGAGPAGRFPAEPGEYYVAASDEPRQGQSGGGTDGSTRVYYPGSPAIRDAAVVQLAAGREARGIDITFAPGATGRVRGFAVDAEGRPLSGSVTLRDSVRSGFPTPAARAAAVAADGAFTFLNVPAGDYVVQASVRGNGRPSQFAMQYVTVTDGDAPLVTIRTSAGTTLRGRIAAEGDTSAVSLDEFGLSVQLADWDWADDLFSENAHARVDADGTFEMTGLHGPLRVTGTAPDGWWLKSVNIGIVDSAEHPYTFGAVPRIDNVIAVFADTSGEVTGRVVDGGRPLADCTVLVFSTDRNRWWAPSGYVKLAITATDGTFRDVPLPPGEYLVAAVDTFDRGSDWLDPEVLATLAPAARRITVAERQTVHVDLDLIRRRR